MPTLRHVEPSSMARRAASSPAVLESGLRLDRIHELLAEVGGLIEDVDAIVETGPLAWTLQHADGSDLQLEYLAEETQAFALSATIGAPSPEHECAVLRALMLFNGDWRATGGVRATASADGALALVYEWQPVDDAATEIAPVIENFAHLQRRWAASVSEGCLPENDFHASAQLA